MRRPSFGPDVYGTFGWDPDLPGVVRPGTAITGLVQRFGKFIFLDDGIVASVDVGVVK